MGALEASVQGLGYDLVDVERLPRGLLRISIDRIAGHPYPVESAFVTVDDCETVTRQLQLVFEVEGVDYERLEVSSPGLDRPLRKPQDWDRFCGLEVDVTFKLPFQGRRKFRGLLSQSQPQPRLIVKEGKTEQALDFALDEVREARLVPVVDFKGRAQAARNGEQET
ncbi:MAG: ribosome maturation factor RimP [Burkholderiales bacterium]|nr:ribosome maturation factor RimP [Burkholderiales bacterium]NBO75955.1 ribosome maturation factor RimP [Betaproteobacteria bacterium]